MKLVRRNSTDMWPVLAGEIFGNGLLNRTPQAKTAFPAVNIKEDAQGFVLELAVPGMTKSDFNIKLDENKLTISHEKKVEKAEDEKTYTRKEFGPQNFERTFLVPENADKEKIAASYQEGVLKLTIPVLEEEKKKTIAVG